MALTHNQDCPFCKVKNSQFVVRGHYLVSEEEKYIGDEDYLFSGQAFFLASCAGCEACASIECVWSTLEPKVEQIKFAASRDATGTLSASDYEVKATYPETAGNKIPGYLPENIENFLNQALSCARTEAWDAAGMTFRKCLDVATKELSREKRDGEAETSTARNSLNDRIKELGKKHLLTKELADLGHIIRKEGNYASHDDDPYTRDEVFALEEYIIAFLTYAFTVPGMLKKTKEKHNKNPKKLTSATSAQNEK